MCFEARPPRAVQGRGWIIAMVTMAPGSGRGYARWLRPPRVTPGLGLVAALSHAPLQLRGGSPAAGGVAQPHEEGRGSCRIGPIR